MSRANRWSISAVLFVIAMAMLGALVDRATHRAARVIENRFGYTPDPAGMRAFLATLDEKYFSEAGADAMRGAKGVDTFLWRQVDAAHRARYGTPFVVGKQGIGDCVSWGAAHAVFFSECVSWSLGKLPEPPLFPATEALYGGARVEARGLPGDGMNAVGGWSDGATGYGAAKFLREFGVVYRAEYPSADLREYSPDRARNYGAYGCGGQGDRGRLDAEAKRHPLKHIVAIRSWDELCSAIESGYPCTVASSQGFSSTRDKQGISEASGTWQHQMCCIGIRHRANGAPDDLVCLLNSWGTGWNGPKENKFPADQPDGSFWVRRSVIERMLGDAWAVGDTDGFKYRDLDHGGWLEPAPEAARRRRVSPAKLIAEMSHIAF
jgi:hypothetical protein